MSESEPRPRPQYGEYASESEQRDHIREPARVETPLTPPVTDPAVGVRPGMAPMGMAPSAALAKPANQTDRIITYVLLGIGAYMVFSMSLSLFNFPEMAEQSYKTLGIEGGFTNVQQGKLWGAVAGIVLVLSYALSVIIAFRRLKANKPAWWICLVGAVAAFIAITICISVPLMNDPAFMNAVNNGVPMP